MEIVGDLEEGSRQLAEEYSPLAKLQIEHIRPKKHGGTDAIENLVSDGTAPTVILATHHLGTLHFQERPLGIVHAK
jgi:hypothetical protein